MDRYARRFWIVNGLFFLLRLLLAAHLPLSPDEAYYWLWSAHPAWGYLDHPPMVAGWIALSTAFFGNGAWALRLGAPVAMALIAWIVFDLAREEFGPADAFRVTLALQAVPFANLGGVILTPDTPLLLFWTLSLALFVKALKSDGFSTWLLLGLAMGLGFLSKYVMVLFPVAAGIVLFCRPDKKAVPGFAIALAVAGMLFLPTVLWNAGNDWISFRFQWAHGTSGSGRPAENLGGFLLAQLFLFGFGFWFWLLRRPAGAVPAVSADVPSSRVFAVFGWFPLLFFLPFAAFSHAEAGWAAAAYPGLLLLAFGRAAKDPPRRFSWNRAVALSAGLSALVILWGFGVFGENPVLGPVKRLNAEAQAVFGLYAEDIHHLPFAADNYRLASLAAFYLAPPGELVAVRPHRFRRPSQFDFRPEPDLSRGFVWIADRDVEGPPVHPPETRLDCAYADERFPERLKDGRYSFLVCLPAR